MTSGAVKMLKCGKEGCVMLLRFRVVNHASLRDEQELSLIADDRHEGRADQEVSATRYRAVPVAAIYGPNASGKSNVIGAIAWMRSAVLRSFRSWDPAGGVPRNPFLFRERAEEEPSEYAMEFLLDGVRYEYGFTVDSERVLTEWLHSFPEGRQRKLYERFEDEPIQFGRGLAGRRKMIADLLRPNSLYLSVAAAQGHELLGSIFRWFRAQLRIATDGNVEDRMESTVDLLLPQGDARPRETMTQLLRLADLGVSGVRADEIDEEFQAEVAQLDKAIRGVVGDRVSFKAPRHHVRVEHSTPMGTFPLPLAQESSGTRTWIGLLGPVVQTLLNGSVLCVDELDARLHPYLTDALVRVFQSAGTNTRGAQLIFSTHEASLLGRNSSTELSRDQVWFTEMDRDRATRVFPLTEFRVRESIENLERRYLTGRYGALPHIDLDLLAGLARGDDGGGDATRKAAGPGEGDSFGAA